MIYYTTVQYCGIRPACCKEYWLLVGYLKTITSTHSLCPFSPFFHSRRLCGHPPLFPHALAFCCPVLQCSCNSLLQLRSALHVQFSTFLVCVFYPWLVSQAWPQIAISLASQRLPFLPLQIFAVAVPESAVLGKLDGCCFVHSLILWCNTTEASFAESLGK